MQKHRLCVLQKHDASLMWLRNTENNKPALYVLRDSKQVLLLLYREMLIITLYYSEEIISTVNMNA